MISEYGIGKDVGGSGRGFDELPLHLPAEKPEETARNSCSSADSSTTNVTSNRLGMNSGLRGEKPTV
jgi:hypothetical protein